MTAEPPSLDGAVHDTDTWPSPAVPDTPVGAPGVVRGVAAVEAVAVPDPAAFTARNCTL